MDYRSTGRLKIRHEEGVWARRYPRRGNVGFPSLRSPPRTSLKIPAPKSHAYQREEEPPETPKHFPQRDGNLFPIPPRTSLHAR
jgi:hypothetical protein